MKLRQTIKDLNALGKDTVFPGCNFKFDAYRTKLREVVDANFDYPVVNTLEYCCDSQTFFIMLTIGSTLAGHWGEDSDDKRTGFELARQFEIDPQQPITPQINAALKAHEALKERHHLVQILLHEHLSK